MCDSSKFSKNPSLCYRIRKIVSQSMNMNHAIMIRIFGCQSIDVHNSGSRLKSDRWKLAYLLLPRSNFVLEHSWQGRLFLKFPNKKEQQNTVRVAVPWPRWVVQFGTVCGSSTIFKIMPLQRRWNFHGASEINEHSTEKISEYRSFQLYIFSRIFI